MTSGRTNGHTSSPESEDGTTPSNSQDGQQLGLFGRALPRVSRSASPGNDVDSVMRGTFGPNGSGSSESADLQRSLENKLRQMMASGGSTLCVLTWKTKATPLGRQISLLRASALRTSDNGFGFAPWPTPMSGSPKTVAYNEAGDTCNGRRTRILVQAPGTISSGLPVGTENPGQLSKNFSRWLMGYPVEWSNCAPTGTRSCRKSQRRSSNL